MAKPTLKVVNNVETSALAEITRRVEDGKPHHMMDVLVTPEIAKLLMSFNVSGQTNRRLSKAGLMAATQALLENRWENTGEPVIMSDKRLMNDGQHRLQAVINTGKSAEMDIRFGISRHAFAATNSGGKRTGADALLVNGVQNGTSVSAVARLVLAYEIGLPTAVRQRISNSKIVEAVERWPDIADSIKYTAALPKRLRSAPIMTLAFFALRTANPTPKVKDFFEVLETGEGRRTDPPHMLQQAILKMEGGADSGTRALTLALGIKAWNAYRSGAKLEKLDLKKAEPYPKIDGLKL